MHQRQDCVDCRKLSPETETNYTLISARHGWRLRREQLPDGTLVVEWRCPACWREFKASGGEAVPSSRRIGGKPTSGTHATAQPQPEDTPTFVEPRKRRGKTSSPPARQRRRS